MYVTTLNQSTYETHKTRLGNVDGSIVSMNTKNSHKSHRQPVGDPYLSEFQFYSSIPAAIEWNNKYIVGPNIERFTLPHYIGSDPHETGRRRVDGLIKSMDTKNHNSRPQTPRVSLLPRLSSIEYLFGRTRIPIGKCSPSQEGRPSAPKSQAPMSTWKRIGRDWKLFSSTASTLSAIAFTDGATRLFYPQAGFVRDPGLVR